MPSPRSKEAVLSVHKNLSLSDAVAAVTTNWAAVLGQVWNATGPQIDAVLATETGTVFPPRDLVFRTFDMFDMEETRVVILGQDPYIRPGQAMGLSFSVPATVSVPPSLRNVFKELERAYGAPRRTSPDLTDWARQGVMLLNTALTVRAGESGSHAAIWTRFTESILEEIAVRTENVVFMLWGAHAQRYLPLLRKWERSNAHCLLTWSHPSPLSGSRIQ